MSSVLSVLLCYDKKAINYFIIQDACSLTVELLSFVVGNGDRDGDGYHMSSSSTNLIRTSDHATDLEPIPTEVWFIQRKKK